MVWCADLEFGTGNILLIFILEFRPSCNKTAILWLLIKCGKCSDHTGHPYGKYGPDKQTGSLDQPCLVSRGNLANKSRVAARYPTRRQNLWSDLLVKWMESSRSFWEAPDQQTSGTQKPQSLTLSNWKSRVAARYPMRHQHLWSDLLVKWMESSRSFWDAPDQQTSGTPKNTIAHTLKLKASYDILNGKLLNSILQRYRIPGLVIHLWMSASLVSTQALNTMVCCTILTCTCM